MLLHSPLLHLSLPSSLCLPSLLPDLSSLPSCPLTASCCGSYHSRKRDTVSAQSNQHQPLQSPFSLAITALNGSILAPLGSRCLQGGWGDITEAMSPIWAKSVNGLIYHKQYGLYFTAYRGTINLKWPGMFLFMYLFIWEEAVGTLRHYQLILLRGVFLSAEEIVCFDLLCKSVPYSTATGDHMRPRLC